MITSAMRGTGSIPYAMRDTETFHQFVELPKELQIKVWEFAVPPEDPFNLVRALLHNMCKVALDGESDFIHFDGPFPRKETSSSLTVVERHRSSSKKSSPPRLLPPSTQDCAPLLEESGFRATPYPFRRAAIHIIR